MFLTLFLLLHSDILAQGMVHAAAIAGHAETERAPCCLPYCLGGFSAAIIRSFSMHSMVAGQLLANGFGLGWAGLAGLIHCDIHIH